GSTLRAPDSLVGVPRGKIERRDRLLLELLRLQSPIVGGREQDRCRVARIERCIEIDGARGGDERIASPGRRRIEKPLCTIEPAGGYTGERVHLVGAPARGAGRDPLGDRALREAVKRNELTAGQDRRRERAELARDEED